MIMNPEFHFIVALFLGAYIIFNWRQYGRNIAFFKTFNRVVWRGASKFNNGWWSILDHNYCLLQANNRILKEFFIMDMMVNILIIFGMAWFISTTAYNKMR